MLNMDIRRLLVFMIPHWREQCLSGTTYQVEHISMHIGAIVNIRTGTETMSRQLNLAAIDGLVHCDLPMSYWKLYG